MFHQRSVWMKKLQSVKSLDLFWQQQVTQRTFTGRSGLIVKTLSEAKQGTKTGRFWKQHPKPRSDQTFSRISPKVNKLTSRTNQRWILLLSLKEHFLLSIKCLDSQTFGGGNEDTVLDLHSDHTDVLCSPRVQRETRNRTMKALARTRRHISPLQFLLAGPLTRFMI